jgi:hypothetical protein
MTAIHLAPARAINDLAVARLLWRSGETLRAREWAGKALELEPNYWEAYLWKARCLGTLGHSAEAILTLKNLRQRHNAFQAFTPFVPSSPYEDAILRYDDNVVSDLMSGT